MAPRLEFQLLLTEVLGSGNVYFQPPPTVKMQYPCIIYSRSNINTDFADNLPYRHKTRYQVTVVDSNPDSTIHEQLGMLPLSSYDRFYVADNLNHDVYTIFF